MPTLTPNEQLTFVVAATGVLISMVAALIALFQLRAGVRQGRHHATFEHLGRARALLREISDIDPAEARAAALAYWTHQADELSPSARSYLALLDEWDLLGVAYREKQVDRKIVLRALRHTFRNPYNVSREFIGQVKAMFRNPGMYADLDHLIQCCGRPTPRERIAALRGRVTGGATGAAAERASLAEPDSSAENAGDPSVQASTPPPETPTGEPDSPAQRKDGMIDPTPAAPPPTASPPAPRRGSVERGETPAFRPSAPQPPTERK